MNDRRQAPAYLRVADEIRSLISATSPGEERRLPTEHELVRQHGVSRQTARRAFQHLSEEGLIYRVPGRGTFAVPRRNDGPYLRAFGSIEDLLALARDTRMRVIEPIHPVTDAALTATLAEPDGAILQRLRLVREYRDQPFCVTDITLPERIAALITDMPTLADGAAPRTLVGLLDEALEGGIAGATQEMRACPCPPSIARLLGTESGDPALLITRVYNAVDGRPVEHARSHFSSERYVHRSELRRRKGHQ